MGALMQLQRWKLRRQLPWLRRFQKVMFFILVPTALLLLLAAIAGWGSRGPLWFGFAAVAVVAVQSGWMWRYIAGAPTGDTPPLPGNPRAVVVAAYRRQRIYAIALVLIGVIGIVFGIAVNPLHLIWGVVCLLLGSGLTLALVLLIRPRLRKLPENPDSKSVA